MPAYGEIMMPASMAPVFYLDAAADFAILGYRMQRCQFFLVTLPKNIIGEMKKTLTYICMTAFIVLMAACGEDRTYEYEEKTQHNRWMLEVMQDKYLWADAIKDYEPAWKEFFATPASFVSALAKYGSNDLWSYVVVDTVTTDVHERGYFNHNDSYGIDFVLVTDPTGQSTRSVARVLTVYPGSPADEAGLRRNDFIYSVDTYKLSTKNISRLKKGIGRVLEVRHIAKEAQEGTIYWSDADTVRLGASRYVEDIAFPVRSIIGADGHKIGYLMCTRLVSGPVEQGDADTYKTALDDAMSYMKRNAVDEMVIDLRLCNYGDLDMVQRLGSYLYSQSASGTAMLKVEWNSKNAANNRTVPYDASVASLGIDKVAVITSAYTKGAAEWLIHALVHDMGKENVIVVGTPTAGQNVMTAEVGHDYHLHLCPAVAYVCDADGNHDYGSIVPDMKMEEQEYVELGEYGSMDEVLLNASVELMHGRGQDDSQE